MSNEFEVPAISFEIEVKDSEHQTVDLDGNDLRIHGETGTLEITLMNRVMTDEQGTMIERLYQEDIETDDQLTEALETTNVKNPIEFVLGLEPKQKLDIVKAIMKEM